MSNTAVTVTLCVLIFALAVALCAQEYARVRQERILRAQMDAWKTLAIRRSRVDR